MECVKCGLEIVDGAKFCPFCGEKPSFDVCPSCGEVVESNYLFCPNCRFSLRKEEKQVMLMGVRDIEKKTNNKNNLHAWLSLSCYSLLIALLIAFLFMPIGKTNYSNIVADSLNNNNIKIDFDTDIDYTFIETLSMLSYLSEENTIYDFIEYAQGVFSDELSSEIIAAMQSGDFSSLTSSQKRKISDAFEKINPFYLYSIQEVRDASTVNIALILAISLVYIATFIVFIIFFILSIINLIMKREVKSTLNKSLWLLTISVILFLTVNYYNNMENFAMTSGPILLIIVSSLLLLTLIILDLVFNKDKVAPKLIIKKVVTIFSLILIVLLVNGGSLKYNYTYRTNLLNKKSIVDSESINKFNNNWL
jgi:RNA polymerase subunit RPABC4/transcription elongation factor Spt4